MPVVRVARGGLGDAGEPYSDIAGNQVNVVEMATTQAL